MYIVRSVLVLVAVLNMPEALFGRPSSQNSGIEELDGNGQRILGGMNNEMDNNINPAPAVFHHARDKSDNKHYLDLSNPYPQNIFKPVGAYVELVCEASGSPPPTVHWMKGLSKLSEMDDFYQSNNLIRDSTNSVKAMARVRTRIVINYLLPVHQGEYTCMAESGTHVRYALYNVDVNLEGYPYNYNFSELLVTKVLGAHHVPKISLNAPLYIDELGNDLLLPCRSLGNPAPTIQWLDSNKRIIGKNGRIRVLEDGELSIRALSWADMGQYTCVATNMVGQDTADTFIYPMKPSQPTEK